MISAGFDGQFAVLTNKGNGTFALSQKLQLAISGDLVAADVNGDGKPDVICGNGRNAPGDNTLTVLTNNGDGTFTVAATLDVGSSASGTMGVAAADVNGDGWPDLITANYNENTLTVLTNNGDGTFTISSSPGVNGRRKEQWINERLRLFPTALTAVRLLMSVTNVSGISSCVEQAAP